MHNIIMNDINFSPTKGGSINICPKSVFSFMDIINTIKYYFNINESILNDLEIKNNLLRFIGRPILFADGVLQSLISICKQYSTENIIHYNLNKNEIIKALNIGYKTLENRFKSNFLAIIRRNKGLNNKSSLNSTVLLSSIIDHILFGKPYLDLDLIVDPESLLIQTGLINIDFVESSKNKMLYYFDLKKRTNCIQCY